MKINMVIGASGMVGEHIVTTLKSLEQKTFATYNKNTIPFASYLNVTNEKEVNRLVKDAAPKIIFMPAALTNVDYCETHPEEAYNINVSGVKNVVKASNSLGSRLIYFSTDYIFDGNNGPYDEEATANPISTYGLQKLEAEHYIALFAKDYLIIRTTVVYGWERQGKNFIHRLVNSLSNGMPVNVPTDQIGSPTYANNLSQIAVHLSETTLSGVINITGKDQISRYEFAKKAANVFHLDENLVIPVQTETLQQSARRPKQAGLLTNKVNTISSIPVINCEEGLAVMTKERP